MGGGETNELIARIVLSLLYSCRHSRLLRGSTINVKDDNRVNSDDAVRVVLHFY